MDMKFYYVVAYRWGNSNGHQYVVSVGCELGKVILDASREQFERGGKYGIAVYEHGSDEMLNYFPSCKGESRPTFNPRIYAIDMIGTDVMCAVSSGTIFVPDPERPGYNKCEQPEIPEWLVRLTEKHLATAEAISSGQEEVQPIDPA